MIDPLAEVVALLRPCAHYSKYVSGAGPWRVQRNVAGQPFYCAVLEGGIRLTVDGGEVVTLKAGDFVLIPSAQGYMTSSLADSTAQDMVVAPTPRPEGGFRLGQQDGPADVQLVVGHCLFGSPDVDLLVSLLPQLVMVRGAARLSTLVQLVGDESRAARPAREMVLSRLLEVLLIEAMRSTTGPATSPGMLRGLADDRLAVAIRRMHESPARVWTVPQLAKEAALSRSTFFARFTAAVGMAPMAYLLGWRMALGKAMLRRHEGSVAEVARHVGYGSASAFSTAFQRHVGLPPTQYAAAKAAVLDNL